MQHTVDLSALYGPLNEALLTLLTGFAGWVATEIIAWVRSHLKFVSEQTDAQLAAGLNRALSNGVAIAMQKTDELETLYPGLPVKGQVSAWAAQYAVDHSPAAVEHFSGLTMNDLALKALAYLPPVQLDGGAVVPAPIPVEVKPLGLVK